MYHLMLVMFWVKVEHVCPRRHLPSSLQVHFLRYHTEYFLLLHPAGPVLHYWCEGTVDGNPIFLSRWVTHKPIQSWAVERPRDLLTFHHCSGGPGPRDWQRDNAECGILPGPQDISGLFQSSLLHFHSFRSGLLHAINNLHLFPEAVPPCRVPQMLQGILSRF